MMMIPKAQRKLEAFKNTHDEAIETIKRFMDEPSSMNELVKWLLTTDASPYGYLTEDCRGMTSSAESFAQLLHAIHHAVEDDGEITFVTVKGQPRIVFANRYDEYFMGVVLDSSEKDLNYHDKVEVLDITPNEFGRVYDEYIAQRTKKCFLFDAARHSLEFAISNYKHYSCWNDSWVEEYNSGDH
jgi:hypothetical protein